MVIRRAEINDDGSVGAAYDLCASCLNAPAWLDGCCPKCLGRITAEQILAELKLKCKVYWRDYEKT